MIVLFMRRVSVPGSVKSHKETSPRLLYNLALDSLTTCQVDNQTDHFETLMYLTNSPKVPSHDLKQHVFNIPLKVS